jgi:hypothetical protein
VPQIAKTSTRELLRKAYALAFFIHGDEEIATQVVTAAAEKLEVAATAQTKRLYYRPVARDDARNRIWFSDDHLLQRLIYVESESYEKQKEQSETCGEDDLVVYFIKHLIRIALRRNCFYLAIGVCRLLHHYSTAETMQLYEAVAQDPVRLKDDYYYRSRKGVLMNELKERFGDLLHTYRSSHGEERFDTAPEPRVFVELVRDCLTLFTPWSTPCLVPDTFAGFRDIPGLIARSAREQDQAEVNRLHAVMHPNCYARLVRGFGFAAPEEMLAVPQFFLSQDSNGGPRGKRREAPPLSDQKIEAIEQELAQQALRRRNHTSGLLRIAVDGVERARLDPNVAVREVVTIDKTAELVEVFAADTQGDLLLATHLITHREDQDRVVHALELESGERISFELSEAAGNITLAIVYRARTSNAVARLLHRLTDGLSAAVPVLPLRSPALLVALVLVLFAFALLGLRAYLNSRKQPPINQTPVWVASPSPPNQEAVGLNGATPAPSPSEKANRNEKKLPKEKQALGPIPETNPPEERTTDESTRAPSAEVTGVKLSEVRKVFVESLSSDPHIDFVVATLRDGLRSGDVVALTEKRDEADAVLKVSGQQEGEELSVRVMLVNARGDVLWRSQGIVYSGFVKDIGSKLKEDLVGEIRRARNKP